MKKSGEQHKVLSSILKKNSIPRDDQDNCYNLEFNKQLHPGSALDNQSEMGVGEKQIIIVEESDGDDTFEK